MHVVCGNASVYMGIMYIVGRSIEGTGQFCKIIKLWREIWMHLNLQFIPCSSYCRKLMLDIGMSWTFHSTLLISKTDQKENVNEQFDNSLQTVIDCHKKS